jgi:UDP-glucuronate decarboxylase
LALRCEAIIIYWDGKQSQRFRYVDDLIEATLRMINGPAVFTGLIKIGNPRDFTMLELAEQVLKLIASESLSIFDPLPSDDPKQCQPAISLAQDKLGL